MDDDSLTFGLLILLLIAMGIASLLGFKSGVNYDRDKLLTAYCQSIEYTDYTELDGLYYCYDGDRLQMVEWAVN